MSQPPEGFILNESTRWSIRRILVAPGVASVLGYSAYFSAAGYMYMAGTYYPLTSWNHRYDAYAEALPMYLFTPIEFGGLGVSIQSISMLLGAVVPLQVSSTSPTSRAPFIPLAGILGTSRVPAASQTGGHGAHHARSSPRLASPILFHAAAQSLSS